MPRFTVIGLYEGTGQIYADFVDANEPHEAMQLVAHATDQPNDLVIIGAVAGHHVVVAPCEDSGKSALACDFRGDERK